MFLIIVISYIIDNTLDNDILTVVATDHGMISQFLTVDGNALGDFEIGTIDPFPIARSRERSVGHVTRARPRDSRSFRVNGM